MLWPGPFNCENFRIVEPSNHFPNKNNPRNFCWGPVTEGSGKCQEFCSSSSIWDYRVGTIYKWVHSLFKLTSWRIFGKLSVLRPTLQGQNAENLKQIFPEKEYRGLSPNFHIHVSVSKLYIPTRKYVDRFWEYINGSQTHECGNWGWGRAIPRKGIYKRNCHCSASRLQMQ